MTTLVELCTYREWRVNRIRNIMDRISIECGNTDLSRQRAQELSADLHEIADDIADIFVCPICNKPNIGDCSDCPIGALTAK